EIRRLEPRIAPAATSRIALPELPLLVVSEIDGHRRRLQDAFDGTVLTPVCLDGAGISADYLAALRPDAAVIDLSPRNPVAPHVAEMIAAAGVPSVHIGAGASAAAADGETPIDDALADAVYREIV